MADTKKAQWVAVVEASRARGTQKTAKCVEEYVDEPTPEQRKDCEAEMLKLLPPEEGWENHALFVQPIRRKTQTW